MNTSYFPVLKALKAEFTALKNIEPNSASQIVPLFELSSVPATKKYRESSAPIMAFIDDTSEEIGGLWAGKIAMFDASRWVPTATTEQGDHVISYTYNALSSMGVETVPVMGYVRWELEEYQLALQSISRVHKGKFCIRLDHAAFEDSAEPEFFQANLDEILNSLEIDPANCHVILDFEDVTALDVPALLINFNSLFSLVAGYGFASYSIAGCSLPNTINKMVKKPNSCGVVSRKEMLLWQSVRQSFPGYPIYFGDYGVRGPNTNEGVRSKYER